MVSTSCHDGVVLVSFRDNGVGIEPEVLPHIFDAFYTTKERGRGTGLGLSISHSIIEDHGGRIEVDSVPGEGSEFRVYLPVVKAGTTTEPQIAAASAG